MMKRPRQHSEKHLKFIRSLPCIVCGDDTTTEAAHIRLACEEIGKRYVGKGEKPDDIWTLPLCGECHRAQHHIGELTFWFQNDIEDPIKLALALWAHTGQHEVGEQIVRTAR